MIIILDFMSSPSLIAVAGPSGSGKTTWISQYLKQPTTPTYYLCPGLGNASVDQAIINYRFPSVQVIPDTEAQTVLSRLSKEAVVYVELGFYMDLASPVLTSFPCHRVAVVPPETESSPWQNFADEIITGNSVQSSRHGESPQIWCSPLTGQVFDPPSLEAIWMEIIGGAYGQVQRAKGLFELPDGTLIQMDFVDALSGSEYRELNLPRWLEGRPNRFSGIEVVGWNLEESTIKQTLLESCLSEQVLTQYQSYYQETIAL